MPHKIIDTNVFMAASGLADHITSDCERQALDLLVSFLRGQSFKIVLDNLGEALKEYKRNLGVNSNSSTPFTNQFLVHLFNHQYNPAFYVQVQITKVEGGEEGDFKEFPADERLANFKRADRKWVAMAVAHQRQYDSPAPIVYTVDKDWPSVANIVSNYDIQLECICPA
jgi:hypothetical protein